MGRDLGEDAGPEIDQAIEEMEHGGSEAAEEGTATSGTTA